MAVRKRYGLLSLLGTLLLLVAGGCSANSLSKGLLPTATPTPFQLEQMLLDVSEFPPGWRAILPLSSVLEGRGQT